MNEEISPEQLIANELSKLSLKEREEVYEDLHGVRDPIPETPELIKDSIDQMEIEIQKIDDKFAYEQALAISKDFVTKRETRIKFLRADLFNPKKAAERIVRYFQCRLTLFGVQKFVRDIGLDDLDEKTSAAIASGVLQVLPNRDSRGRAVVAGLASFFHQQECIGDEGLVRWSRAFFYTILSITEDEETQKKGMVYVSYTIDQIVKSTETRRKILYATSTIVRGLPIRIVGYHCCHNTPLVSPLLSLIAYTVGATFSVRIRLHYGSHTDCQYSLMTYGIPIRAFPITLGGLLSLTEHEKWIEKRRLKEAYLRKTPIPARTVDLPSHSDVLLGRGRPFILHKGNRLLHEIVGTYFDRYNSAKRDGKTKLAEEIICIVHKYDGHFLKQNAKAGVWVEVSNLEARNKVNHSFRRKREFDLKETSIKKIDVGVEGQEKRLKAGP